MSLIKTEALLLKKINFQDSSNIIHFFTKDHGKISVIAKASRQMKSQFRGYLEPLNHLSLIYYDKPTRDIQTLSKVDLIHEYISNPKNIEANTYATAILETIDKIIHTNEENDNLFDMAINILNFLDKFTDNGEVAFILFLLGAIKLLGYEIDLKACHYCGSEIDDFFYNEENAQPHCGNCAGKNFEKITRDQLIWLRKADFLDLQKPILTKSRFTNSARIGDFLLNYAGMHFDFSTKLHSLDLLKYLK